jgi:3-hydroxymyristoyl/3-hydroxydecanoyl-(acyl carrier protein) dehydratase
MRRVEVSIRFAAGDPCLEGHFPGNPIVPAAAILSELVALVEAELSRTVVEVTRAQFRQPLAPEVEWPIVIEAAGDGKVTVRSTVDGKAALTVRLVVA